jgi:hypothetical protein
METSLLQCCARSDCFIVMRDTNVFIVALLRNCNNFALSIVAATLTLLGQGDLTYATPPRKPNMSQYIYIYIFYLPIYIIIKANVCVCVSVCLSVCSRKNYIYCDIYEAPPVTRQQLSLNNVNKQMLRDNNPNRRRNNETE